MSTRKDPKEKRVRISSSVRPHNEPAPLRVLAPDISSSKNATLKQEVEESKPRTVHSPKATKSEKIADPGKIKGKSRERTRKGEASRLPKESKKRQDESNPDGDSILNRIRVESDVRQGREQNSQTAVSRTLLLQDNFRRFDVGSASTHCYEFFRRDSSTLGYCARQTNDQTEAPAADDGIITVTPKGVLIASVPFKSDSVGDLARYRFLAFRTQKFVATELGEIIIETVMAGRQVGVEMHPFTTENVPNPNVDYRLATAAQVNLDFETLVGFHVFATNDMIYGVYERLPWNKPGFCADDGIIRPDYAAFSYVFPIGDRRDFNDERGSVRVSVAYNKSKGYARWLVNGEERFRVVKVGFHISRKFLAVDHGGEEVPVSPKLFSVGFGILSPTDFALVPHREHITGLIPMYSIDRYIGLRGEGAEQIPTAPAFVESPSTAKTFWCGATLSVQEQYIYNTFDGAEIYNLHSSFQSFHL